MAIRHQSVDIDRSRLGRWRSLDDVLRNCSQGSFAIIFAVDQEYKIRSASPQLSSIRSPWAIYHTSLSDDRRASCHCRFRNRCYSTIWAGPVVVSTTTVVESRYRRTPWSNLYKYISAYSYLPRGNRSRWNSLLKQERFFSVLIRFRSIFISFTHVFHSEQSRNLASIL